MTEGKELGGELVELYRAADEHLGGAMDVYQDAVDELKANGEHMVALGAWWQDATDAMRGVLAQSHSNLEGGANALIAAAAAYASQDEAAAAELKRITGFDVDEYEWPES
ncbi:MAG: hypothetical protein ACRDXX_18845 [Stackebrandtia sp.]